MQSGAKSYVKRESIPRFDHIPAGSLGIDVRYQRPLSRTKLNKITQGFDWASFGVLIVSRRASGSYIILDGQHRHQAVLVLYGMDRTVPCAVHEGLTPEQEAEIFTTCNTARANPRAIDVFRARLFAGDPQAVTISYVVERAGFRVQINSTQTTGGIAAVAAVEKIFKRAGHDGLWFVLSLVKDLWENEKGATDGVVMLGIHYFHQTYTGRYQLDRLKRRLAEVTPSTLLRRARAYSEIAGGSGAKNLAGAILEVYNHKIKNAANRLPNLLDNHPEAEEEK